MDLCSELCLSSRLSIGHAVLHGKAVLCRLCLQTFQQNAVLKGIIDFYHFISLSVTLTFSRSHNVSTKQNLLSTFLKHF